LNFGQTIWDKIEVLLGTSWELREPQLNTLRTYWEHIGNKEAKEKKKKKSSPTSPHPHPTPKRKKQGPWQVHAELFPLAASNFYFQNCLSPFLG
jgi:hypothetical protein